jgi:lipopolysaccharide transport protein LptA
VARGLARFRQKREGKEEYVEGEGERIDYNTNTEVVELFHRAWVKSGEDQVRGDYIWYDAVSEKYLVTAGETSGQKVRQDAYAPSSSQRARMLMQHQHRAANRLISKAPAH